MIYENWITEWKKTLKAIKDIGGETRELLISRKADLKEIRKVEKELGFSLPESFRNVLLEFSSAVSMMWYLPDDFELPTKFRSIFSGECSWSLENIISINSDKDEVVKACFADIGDDYNQVWHNKLAFVDVGNGDYIAFDLNDGSDPRVVFLSHDGDVTNGYVLGSNFLNYINELTGIGCCGPEDWQMTPFIDSSTSCIDSNCCNAQEFKRLLSS